MQNVHLFCCEERKKAVSICEKAVSICTYSKIGLKQYAYIKSNNALLRVTPNFKYEDVKLDLIQKSS